MNDKDVQEEQQHEALNFSLATSLQMTRIFPHFNPIVDVAINQYHTVMALLFQQLHIAFLDLFTHKVINETNIFDYLPSNITTTTKNAANKGVDDVLMCFSKNANFFLIWVGITSEILMLDISCALPILKYRYKIQDTQI